MKSCRWMLVVVVAGLLAGCGAPRIDSSSPETYAKSHEKMRRALSPADQARLEQALKVFFNAELDKRYEAGGLMAVAADAEGIGLALQARLDGLTAKEIFAEAERLAQAKEASARARARKEQQSLLELHRTQLAKAKADLAEVEAELAADQARVKAARELCARVPVLATEWRPERNAAGAPPVVATRLRNDTGQALAGLAAEILVKVMGREVPLVLTRSQQRIANGIQPGEQVTLLWRTRELQRLVLPAGVAREELITVVTIFRLDGVDGKPLTQLSTWGELDDARLSRARASVPRLQTQVDQAEATLAKLGEAAP
jgi:hypothetical protein